MKSEFWLPVYSTVFFANISVVIYFTDSYKHHAFGLCLAFLHVSKKMDWEVHVMGVLIPLCRPSAHKNLTHSPKKVL